eukprot:CAMPEP_0197021120 /NCGR_PEP_ID=MMETSP1384-20130603/2024_1 /TAXON_ID=29189 /ORGANISM="Ammonia sp." /LENGTH=442 /DNA_ID=CAMNT_0042448883 /DNA_START=84 /DNA_END=1409 /DNA_ORIENTATION=+
MSYQPTIAHSASQNPLGQINFKFEKASSEQPLGASCLSMMKSLLSRVSAISPQDRMPLNLEESKANMHCEDDITNDAEKLVAVLLRSYENQLDLGEALVSSFHSSNLKYADYMRRSSLFASTTTTTTQSGNQWTQQGMIEEMFTNYLAVYQKYIEQPIPNTIKPGTHLKPFRDDINIILSYYLTIHDCVNRVNRTHSMQFDAYFASPSTAHDLDNLCIKGMIKSSPKQRARCGLDEIYRLIERVSGVGCGALAHQRYVLLIVRGNAYDSNDDVIYLFQQNMADRVLANARVYDHNAFLWKLHSKQDIIASKLNVDDCKYRSNFNLLCISYHLPSRNSISTNYLYFNGYGQQINKRCILTKWPLLFAHGAQQIGGHIVKQLDLMENHLSRHEHVHNRHIYAPLPNKHSLSAAQIGEDVFGLRYQYKSYIKNPKQQTLTFPKEV